jgi:hypothetical protein
LQNGENLQKKSPWKPQEWIRENQKKIPQKKNKLNEQK